MDWNLLRELCIANAVSGYEENIYRLIEDRLESNGFIVERDYIGNIIAKLPDVCSKSHRLILDAHIDEVGMMVSRVEYGGFLRFIPVGGLSTETLIGQPVLIHGREKIVGIIGSTPPHLKSKDSQSNNNTDDMYIDTGLTNSDIKNIVSVGDIVTFMPFWYENEISVMAKALDNRVGVFLVLSLLGVVKEIVRENKTDFDVVLVFSAQEETGTKGATPISYMFNPDIAIVLEGTVANDVPGTSGYRTLAQCGGGPEIRLSDNKFIAHQRLCRLLAQIAKDYNINHQVIVKKVGGTNAAVYQAGGTRGAITTAVSVPVRYIHSPVSLAYKEDIEDTYDLMEKILLDNRRLLELIIKQNK